MYPSWPSLPDLDAEPGDEQTSTEALPSASPGACSPTYLKAQPSAPIIGDPFAADAASGREHNSRDPATASTSAGMQDAAQANALAAVTTKLQQQSHAFATTRQQTEGLAMALQHLEHMAGAVVDRAAQAEAASTTQMDAMSSTHEVQLQSLQQEVQSLALELSQLRLEKARVEAHRDEVSGQQGQYKGTIAKLEGSVASSERRIKQQCAEIDSLKVQLADVERQLAATRTMMDTTPDRCRSAQRQLQNEALRAHSSARTNEARVKKLEGIVELDAHELHELRDFAEVERLTLLETEGALAAELQQERQRRQEQAAALDAALGDVAALDHSLAQCKAELLVASERCIELEVLTQQQADDVAALQARCAVLEGERDAAAANLRKAERELEQVSDYSTKMFRQVRFISHVLDKHPSLLSKEPDFASLSRELRAFVAGNQHHWDATAAAAKQQRTHGTVGDDAPRASASKRVAYSGTSGASAR